jgi:hypothetical protein
MVAVVSMHQDVWSRFSGGSGAPAWTLEAVGFNLETLEATGAAYLDGVRDKKLKERGVWPTGYQKLAAATMSFVHFSYKIIAIVYPIVELVSGLETRLRQS